MNCTFSRASLSRGEAFCMNGEWKATPADFTSLANTSSDFSTSTKDRTVSTGPEMVTVSMELWQAATTPSGHRALVSSQVKPGSKG